MTDREKLHELLASKPELLKDLNTSTIRIFRLADHLIANGVTFAKDNSVLTNGDRIRAMTDEELAALLSHESYRIAEPLFQYYGVGLTEEVVYCRRLAWLKQPVEESNGG